MAQLRRAGQHRRLLRTLYETRGSTRVDLVERTGLSSATVFRVTKELLNEGWIAEHGKAEAREGRPPERLVLNPAAGFVVGIAVADELQHAVVTDLAGQLVAEVEEPSSIQLATADVVASLDGLIDRVVKAAGPPPSAVLGVGFCVYAIVDPTTGVVSHYERGSTVGPKAKWDPMPLRDLVSVRRPGWFVAADGTARSLALAEAALVQDQDFAYVCVDQGISVALVLDGRPYLGPARIAGELGHFPIRGADDACPCGNRGCLSTAASAPAILRRVEQRLAESKLLTSLEPGPQLTIDAVVAAAEGGDKLAYSVLTEAGDMLGSALSVLLNLMGFELVVIGSRLAASEPFVAATVRAIKLQALPKIAASARVEPSRLFGHGAEARSAANRVLYQVFVEGDWQRSAPPASRAP